MNRRIMTIDELYSFCLKNKFTNFDSKEYGKELVVKMPGNFEKSESETDRMTEGLTPFLSRAFHDNVNLNHSCIEEDDFRNNVPSSHLRPILANVIKNEDTNELDFGSHDCHIEEITKIDENGKEYTVKKTVYDERPIGVIDGTKTTIEYDKDAKVNRAVLHGYLYDEYCQDAIDILNRRGTVNCSVELVIRQMSFDSARKVLVLNDFYVSGLTLLGDGVKPGMADSDFKIEDFSINDQYLNFSNQLIEMQAKLNELEARFNIDNNSMKGGLDKSMNKFKTLLAKYNKTVEDITFDYENLSDDELEAKFAEVFGTTDDENSDDSDDEIKEDNACGTKKKKKKCEEETDDSNDDESDDEDDTVKEDNACGGTKKKKKKCEEESDDEPESDDSDDDETDPEVKEDNACGGAGSGSKKKKKKNSVDNEAMTRTYEISHDDIRYALYNLLSSYEESDNEWYCITAVYDLYFVYESWNGGKIYGQKYTKDNDNVAFDGERYTLHKEYLTDSEYTELQSMRSNYASLKEFKETTEKNELHAQREGIINSEQYSVIASKNESGEYTNKDFAKLVSEMDKYSLADLEKEAKVILADFYTTNQTFSLNSKSEKPSIQKKIFTNPENKSTKKTRYGNLFSKK